MLEPQPSDEDAQSKKNIKKRKIVEDEQPVKKAEKAMDDAEDEQLVKKAKKKNKESKRDKEEEEKDVQRKAQDSDSSEPDEDDWEFPNWAVINVGGLKFAGQNVVPAIENIWMRRGCKKCGYKNKLYCGYRKHGWKIRPGDKAWQKLA